MDERSHLLIDGLRIECTFCPLESLAWFDEVLARFSERTAELPF